jgi:hypothetical protein
MNEPVHPSLALVIAHHHLVMVVPIAAVVVVLAAQAAARRGKAVWAIALLVAIVHAGSAVPWNIAAARGLRKTGGTDAWSDPIFSVNDYNETERLK